ncbi:MAG: hypothetical protein NTNFB02_27910 [Nitrospira sp.]
MRARHMMINYAALLLGFATLVAGCASWRSPVESDVPPAALKAYDLPGDVDPNAMIRVLQDSFLRVLKAPPTVTEGAMPTPVPLVPSGVLVESRVLTLHRLGAVNFPHVICPHSLAMIEGLRGVSQTVYRFTACIQPYRDGYRVHLIETRAALADEGLTQSRTVPASDLLVDLAESVMKALPLTQAALSLHGEATAESARPLRAIRDADRDSIDPAKQTPTRETFESHEIGYHVEAISPLVCHVPERSGVVIRSSPGEGPVVGTLGSEFALGEHTPLDGAFLRIHTEQGLAGWVQKSDLRWSPCPVG